MGTIETQPKIEPFYMRLKAHADRTVRCLPTLKCRTRCSYCSVGIRLASETQLRAELAPDVWAEGLNRRRRQSLLTGGEPLLYRGLPKLLTMLEPKYKMEIYTALSEPIEPILEATSRRFVWLVSAHPTDEAGFETWRERVDALVDAGHSVRLHVVRAGEEWPTSLERLRACGYADRLKIATQGDQRRGRAAGARANEEHPVVHCQTRYFVFGPNGRRYQCMHDLIRGRRAHEGIWDDDGPDWLVADRCDRYGYCSPCDNPVESIVEDRADAD